MRWLLLCLLGACGQQPPAVAVKDIHFTESDPVHVVIELSIGNPGRSEIRVDALDVQLSAQGKRLLSAHRDAFSVPPGDPINVTLAGSIALAAFPPAVLRALRIQRATWVVDGALKIPGRTIPLHHTQKSNTYRSAL